MYSMSPQQVNCRCRLFNFSVLAKIGDCALIRTLYTQEDRPQSRCGQSLNSVLVEIGGACRYMKCNVEGSLLNFSSDLADSASAVLSGTNKSVVPKVNAAPPIAINQELKFIDDMLWRSASPTVR